MPRRERQGEEAGAWGGIHQRSEVGESSGCEVVHCQLALFLLSHFKGEATLPLIVQIAKLVLEEPPDADDPRRISQLGANGANTNSMKRDLFQRLAHFSLEAAGVTVRLPVKLLGNVSWVNSSMIYPHVIFERLYE